MMKRTTTIVSSMLAAFVLFLLIFIPLFAQEEPAEPLTVQLYTTQNPVTQGTTMTWYVMVSSIVTEEITAVSFHSVAEETWRWDTQPDAIDVLTGTQSLMITAVPLISGDLNPILNVTALVAGQPQSFLVTGAVPVTVNSAKDGFFSFIWYRIPARMWDFLVIFVSVILGACVTLFTQFWQDKQVDKKQKVKNKSRVYSLLNSTCLQTKYAANNGSPADMSMLNTIFETEGLFDVLFEHELVKQVQELWEGAEKHNFGLDKSGGMERAVTLQNATNRLLDALTNFGFTPPSNAA